MTRKLILSAVITGFVAASAFQTPAFAAADKPSESSTKRFCASGEIYDLKTKKCNKVK